MRRRNFIGSCAAGMLVAGVGSDGVAGPVDEFHRLLVLASVIAPDSDLSLWSEGEPARRLRQAWERLDPEESNALTGLLDKLDGAAGGSFGALGPEDRILALRRFLGEPADWPAAFRAARTLAVRAFYDSPVGCARAGYIPATQFAGYPQLRNYPPGRGGS